MQEQPPSLRAVVASRVDHPLTSNYFGGGGQAEKLRHDTASIDAFEIGLTSMGSKFWSGVEILKIVAWSIGYVVVLIALCETVARWRYRRASVKRARGIDALIADHESAGRDAQSIVDRTHRTGA